MKKGLIFLLSIVSFLGINSVSASEIYLEYDTNINEIQPYIEELGYETINNAINENIKYYNENLSSDYPYYIISLNKYNDNLHVVLSAFDDSGYEDYFSRYFDQTFDTSYILINRNYTSGVVQIEYDFDSNNISILGINDGFNYLSLFDIDSSVRSYNVYNYYYSNFDLYYRGDLFIDGWSDNLTYLSFDDTLYFPLLDDSTKYSVHQANTKFLIEPYHLYDDNDSFETEVDNYVLINLNDYSYVALSLKDYSSTETFYTNMYVKGQLCLTPIYNYGMTEKGEYYSSYQVDRCSSHYSDFTLVRTYILADDLKNNAIYYLKAYDTSKENIVKIDTSVFDITYITEETEDNPYVVVNGKSYPTIAYDSLTSSATKSEDEDYVSGASCQVGDFNCYTEYNPNNIFDDLFDKPLEMLKTVWSAILSIFNLIAAFIALLPPTMQGFLYISFGITIILGVIKVLI